LLQWLTNLAVRIGLWPMYTDSTASLKGWLRIAFCFKIIAMDHRSTKIQNRTGRFPSG